MADIGTVGNVSLSDAAMSSSVEDEVMQIRKQFEKMTSEPDIADQSQALYLLTMLSCLKINLNVLTTTRIGMTVNALRKSSSDDEVRNAGTN